MSQIISITSEALQATVRRLLPSQQGFGEDLQASNVILPVVDLTPTAEGSQLSPDLARAMAFTDVTPFAVQNSGSTIINTAGFFRIFGNSTITDGSAAGPLNEITMTDGLSAKRIWAQEADTTASTESLSVNVDFIVFVNSGESITCSSNNNKAIFNGSTRQVADLYGNITNPSGFTFE